MKRILLIAVVAFMAFVAKAQEPMFLKNDLAVNLGVGLNSYPVVSISAEKGIMDGVLEKGTIGIGGYAGLGAHFRYNYSVFALGARGTFHYPIIDKFDTYLGLAIGGSYFAYSGWRSLNYFHIVPGFFLGGRYPITEKFNVFGEIGYGASYLTAGISFKL
jgi:hypothetical protein